MVLGTDNLFSWPLAEFVDTARSFRPKASIALSEATSRAVAVQSGVVMRDHTSRITAFIEKSPDPPSQEIALAVYFFPVAMCDRIQRFLDDGGNPDAPGYFIEWLVRQDTVYGIKMPGMWYDIGTRESYETVVQNWRS